ncbi:MAG TPA: leucine--tRNA ligase [Planctomycetaceae bacterium]|nr:leucine--tRNA ligase [Blastopirellula sp.]HAY81905.1 leucine--tRNA ligase [Planctomycetaceae bacterium]
MPRYNPAVIEPKWQEYWEQQKTFKTPDMPVGDKLYVLDMFPYPSGNGLHVGHPEGYTATDIVCRFERMRGKSVLHPMGFDAFGLPAEEHAIKTNTPPRTSTEKNIATFTRQLKMLGFSYDWDREIATTDVDYFHWTQWIFLQLFDTWFDADQQIGRPIAELPIPAPVSEQGEAAVRRYQDEHRLAYQSDALVNWCPALGTVLANEEVIDGKSERGGHPVERRPLRQWMLRITAYADRLEKDLDTLDWSESIKTMQREWIGRSTGANVDFYIGTEAFAHWQTQRQASGFPTAAGDDVLRIYTTRPDTLFGATYMVIAPEHPFVERLTTDEQREAVAAYCQTAAHKSDRERQEDKEKTGVFTGSYAINPVNGERTPVWISDYVLISYGTGAIMAVPAHDTRDFEFATKFGLPIVPVVDPAGVPDVDAEAVMAGKACFVGLGKAINSGEYNGTETSEFKTNITAALASQGTGTKAVNYKLRDWLFSRQRFWGEPFPILHELDADGEPTGLLRAVDEAELPVDLPHLDDYKPHGKPEPPLGKSPEDWLYVEIDGTRYRRETNTMPQWAGSCWYYLRFIDPTNQTAFLDPAKEQAWMPVDLYVGGAEHAVLHLLYARFWHKVLYDRGHVTTKEPFQRLVNQGMILGEMEYTAYQTEDGNWVSTTDVTRNIDRQPVMKSTQAPLQEVRVEDVVKRGEGFVLTENESIRVESRAFKMSKSRGNVVNPDEIVRDYGADALRLYEMFMGPLEATKPWSMAGVNGVRGFLDRVWRMMVDERADATVLHAAIQDAEPTEEQERVLHKTIMAVTRDLERMEFNTAIARMMEFVNFFTKQETRPTATMQSFVLILSPYAPHIAEELWQLLGNDESLAYAPWPAFDEAKTKTATIEVPVQIKGKIKAKIQVSPDCSQADLLAAAKADPTIAELIADKQIIKEIAVPGRMVNLVVK